MLLGGDALEAGVPARHVFVREAGGAQQGLPALLVHDADEALVGAVLQDPDDQALLIAQLLDLGVELVQALLQRLDQRALAARLQDAADGRQRQAGAAESADLLQALDVLGRV
ncbi:MAG: hypothetical protein U1A78_30245 [Polyangia bacterium]